jgi:hypothetical protein
VPAVFFCVEQDEIIMIEVRGMRKEVRGKR